MSTSFMLTVSKLLDHRESYN